MDALIKEGVVRGPVLDGDPSHPQRAAAQAVSNEGSFETLNPAQADAVAYGRDLPKERRVESLRDIAKRLSALLVRHRRYSQAREIDRMAEEF